MSDSTFENCWLNTSCPHQEEGLCLLSISETGNWERVPGSGPRKGARPSSLLATPQNYSDQLPQASLPRSRTPGRMKQQEGMWSGGCRAKGTVCFQHLETFPDSPPSFLRKGIKGIQGRADVPSFLGESLFGQRPSPGLWSSHNLRTPEMVHRGHKSYGGSEDQATLGQNVSFE